MPTPRVKEGFLEEEMSDVRLEGTGVHQAKIERRVLGRGDRGLQRPERMIELDWSVTERDGRNLQGAGRYVIMFVKTQELYTKRVKFM